MHTIGDYLNLASVILTFVLVLSTIAYAVLTYKITKANEGVLTQMRSQAEAERRPYVVIRSFTKSGNPLIYLTIENKGRSSAQNIRFVLSKQIPAVTQGGKPLNEFPLFKNGIVSFSPNASHMFLLANGTEIFNAGNADRKAALMFDIVATYQYGQVTYRELTIIDLSPFEQSQLNTDPIAEDLHKISRELEKLNDRVKSLSERVLPIRR